MRPAHATRGETLPNCYKNSSSPEKCTNEGKTREEQNAEEIAENNTHKRPTPPTAKTAKVDHYRTLRPPYVP